MRTRLIAVFGLMLGLAVLSVPVTPSPASTLSSSQLLTRSVNAALGATSLQFVDRTRASATSQTLVGAISPQTAGEELTGGKGTQPLTVELIGGVVYVQTTASVLQSGLGLPAAGASQGAGKWVAVQSSDAAFGLLTQRLTISTELQSFVPASNVRFGKPAKIGKNHFVTITGSASSTIVSGAVGTAFLVLSSKAPFLPLEGGIALQKSSGFHLNEAVAFTHWNKRITLTPPTGSISYASLVG